MLYYAVGEHGYEGGFTVTASHNPKQYNGMKMVRRGALPVGSESGLDQIKASPLGRVPGTGRSAASSRSATSSAASPSAACRSST